MTRSVLKSIVLAGLTAGAAFAPVLLLASNADAHGGKEYFAETYRFSKPMNGYEGFQGAYHCSYMKVPKTVCQNGRCTRIWELTQTCQ